MGRVLTTAVAAAIPAALLALAYGVAPTTAQGGNGGYTVTMLANPSMATYTYANDINDSGRIAGAQEYVDWGLYRWVQEALVWPKHDQNPVVLQPINGLRDSWIAALNDRGEACGHSTDWGLYPDPRTATVWDRDGNGKSVHPDLGGAYSSAWDINHFGDVVGISYWPDRARAYVIWHDGDAELLELDTSVYVQSWPYSINKDGIVAGFARWNDGSGWGTTHAVWWDTDGAFHDLHGAIEADLGMTVFASKAWHVHESGAIGGIAAVAYPAGQVTDGRPFVWTEDGGFDWVDTDGYAVASIESGDGKRFLGVVNGTIENWANASAAVWTRGEDGGDVVWDIDTIAPPTGHTGMSVWGTNASGRVVGAAWAPDATWGYAWNAVFATPNGD